MQSFKEFFLETRKGETQSRDRSVFWKDARNGAKPNITYDVNKLSTNEEEKMLKDLRTQGGQIVASPKMIQHLRAKGLHMPKSGEIVHVGRSGESTYQVTVTMLSNGQYVLKGSK